jgi:hypothetical protein
VFVKVGLQDSHVVGKLLAAVITRDQVDFTSGFDNGGQRTFEVSREKVLGQTLTVPSVILAVHHKKPPIYISREKLPKNPKNIFRFLRIFMRQARLCD